MGVCGSGKSTVGRALADAWQAVFDDADDHHLPANRAKLASGTALTDEDRRPWYAALRERIVTVRAEGRRHVMACSALHGGLRAWLCEDDTPDQLRFVLLSAPRELLVARLKLRTGHFMPASLLDSQLATLEITPDLLRVTNEGAPGDVARAILNLIP